MGAVLSDRELYDGIAALVSDRPALKESLTARLADEVNTSMYGRAAHDTIAPETHAHEYMYLSPYARPGAGAAAFVTYTNTTTGQVYVLLALKPEGNLVPPGGYMEVHEPEGGKPDKPFDQNLMENSRRELLEETGLKINAKYKPKSLGVCSDYGISNDKRLQTVVEGFHYNLFGAQDTPPEVHGMDDIKEARWVKAEDVFVAPLGQRQEHGSANSRFMVKWGNTNEMIAVRDDYGEHVVRAISIARHSMKHLDHVKPAAVIQTAEAQMQGKLVNAPSVAAGRWH